MTVSSPSSRRVLRDIEVRDMLSLQADRHRSYSEEDLEEAYRRGEADARVAMMSEREDAVRGLAVTMQESAEALGRAVEELRAHYCGSVVDDAFAFAAWLVCREVTADPSLMRARVEEALTGFEDEAPVITVAPSMTELIETWIPSATVRPDSAMRPGEVRVLSSSTTIDGTFADALRRLRAAFDADPIGGAAR